MSVLASIENDGATLKIFVLCAHTHAALYPYWLHDLGGGGQPCSEFTSGPLTLSEEVLFTGSYQVFVG